MEGIPQLAEESLGTLVSTLTLFVQGLASATHRCFSSLGVACTCASLSLEGPFHPMHLCLVFSAQASFPLGSLLCLSVSRLMCIHQTLSLSRTCLRALSFLMPLRPVFCDCLVHPTLPCTQQPKRGCDSQQVLHTHLLQEYQSCVSNSWLLTMFMGVGKITAF